MALFFIEESKEINKYKLKIKNILNKIEEKSDENKIFLSLPIKPNSKIKDKKIKKIINKLEQYKIKTAVISNELYENIKIKNHLYSKNINILDGKYLLKILTEDVVKYICKKTKISIEKTEISVLTNDWCHINKEVILELAQKVKTLNIVTNHIEEFKNIEDYLYNEKGIIIKISNNQKIALAKTNIIINMDFPEELINKYVIPNKCIILNINGEIKIKTKKFNGININDYNIIIPEKYKIKGFEDKFIYESILLNIEYKKARKQILEDKIQIKELIGEKGVIRNREFDAK